MTVLVTQLRQNDQDIDNNLSDVSLLTMNTFYLSYRQVRFGERRCVAAVQRNQVTFFEVLDFGVYNVEEDNNITGENGEWIPRRTTVGVNDGDASS